MALFFVDFIAHETHVVTHSFSFSFFRFSFLVVSPGSFLFFPFLFFFSQHFIVCHAFVYLVYGTGVYISAR